MLDEQRVEMSVTRSCGDCQACCTILPVPPVGKKANARCPHQRFGKGCTIYDRRPIPCKVWSCRWLVDDDAADLRRPDRCGYVVDIMPDFVTIEDHETGRSRKVEVVQIWCDPRRPLAYRDPPLMAWLEREHENRGVLGLVRFDESRALVLMPPAATLAAMGQNVWREVSSPLRGKQHTPEEIAAAVMG